MRKYQVNSGVIMNNGLVVMENSRFLMKGFMALLMVWVLSGCQFMMSDLTKVDLRLVAGGDLNLDDSGRPSPLVVRLLELKSVAGFENADFFSLYAHEQSTLGADLISSEEFELKPGDVQDVKFSLNPEANFIAVMGAYRRLDKVAWRLVLPLQMKSKNNVTVLLGSQGIAMASTR